MAPRPRLPSRDPLLQDESDRLVYASKRAVDRQNSEIFKLDDQYEELLDQAENSRHEQEKLIEAYHGADSKVTRLDGQNKRLRTQLELVGVENDELKAHNSDLVRRLAESERENARLKSAEKDKKRKREDLPSPFEEGPDADESASKTEKSSQAKVHGDLVLGRPKPQEMAAAVQEEKRAHKRPRRRRHRDDTTRSTVKAAVEVEADVVEKMNA
ncbi:uncharacterized protein J4E84_004399 [Alternaria hordeiaustralica]|uniref:uncharacterized protein n=1 Tax=Alternaria hordeiaustralica TaxID=1187925 RepID=UPI0020C2FB9A|nr:uncharacterized protein J4E84_004399 [Alternaria hordeiaustralica]KAI4690215.1 hypothetical protein J4E84_004399 [Alternaria hordeiaustralica]